MKDKYLQLRESPLAETLLSIEICLTLMSWLLIIRGSDEFVVISPVAQYLPLILVLIHVLIRRKILNLLPQSLLEYLPFDDRVLHTFSVPFFLLSSRLLPGNFQKIP